ncbi:MAG: hypothetical protein D6800_03135 [Candidatus Zixiibacteriota bacterium]|nr:MAG: hypothetical protein D6800_03135 [candidate division Zixibacteria bacterium]
MSLIWRKIRDPERGGASVVGVRSFRRAQLSLNPEIVKDEIIVPEHTQALGVFSGRTSGASDRLEAEWMREEPILLTLPEDAETRHVLARPVGEVSPRSIYRQPVLLSDSEYMVPGVIFPDGRGFRVFPASSIGHGCYICPRGAPWLQGVYVGPSAYHGYVDYDPYHGIIYLEGEDGSPLIGSDGVEIVVSLERSWIHPTPEHGGVYMVGVSPYQATLRIDTFTEYTDERRMPEPLPEDREHAVDWGQYDAGPVATEHLWIIQTDADPVEVEKAVRRVLPAGTIYRVEPYV